MKSANSGVILILVLVLVMMVGCSEADTPENGELPEALAEEIDRLESQVSNLEGELEELRRRIHRLEASPLIGDDGQLKVVVYFGLVTADRILTVPVLREIGESEDPILGALEALILGPSTDQLSPILPPHARILDLQVDDDIVTVNLGDEAADYATGSAGESMVIGSIVNTLTEFPGIGRVRILVEGEAGVSLGGHFDLDEPLERFDGMIP